MQKNLSSGRVGGEKGVSSLGFNVGLRSMVLGHRFFFFRVCKLQLGFRTSMLFEVTWNHTAPFLQLYYTFTMIHYKMALKTLSRPLN